MSNTKLPALKDALDLLNQTQEVLGRFVANHRNPSEKDTISELLGLHDCAAGYAARKAVSETLALLADRERQAGEAVAWMDDFGNVFPLGANKGAGSWLDDHKRNWKPLFASLPAPEAVQAERMAQMESLLIRARDCLDTLPDYPNGSQICDEIDAVLFAVVSETKNVHDDTPRWANVETAMKDPLFQQARAIMGTNTWFQDNALRNVINYVLSAPSPDGKAEEPMRYFPPGSFQTSKPTASNAGEQPDMRRDDSQRHGPDWDAFNVAYEAVCARSISLREIAWRCYRAALASQPPAGEQKPAFVYNGEQYRDLESMLEGYDHGTAFFTAPHPEPVAPPAREASAQWPNVETAMEDPLFQRARGIMGTENWFQDNALRNVINHVLASKPPAGEQKPVGFMSARQLPLIADPDGEGGTYIPIRKTPAGLLTLALYTAPQPEQVAQESERVERFLRDMDFIEEADKVRAARARGEGGRHD